MPSAGMGALSRCGDCCEWDQSRKPTHGEVEAALSALPKDIRVSFERIVHLIDEHGLTRLREPSVKHQEGPVWEMRMKGKDGIARATPRPPPC